MSDPQIPPTADTFDTHALAEAIAEAAWERKARNLRIFDVRGIVSYADYLVICHGTSERHAEAIADTIVDDLRPLKIRPLGIEGKGRGGWVLVDFADAVLHVFANAEARVDVNLEGMYSDAPLVKLDPPEDLEDDLEVVRATPRKTERVGGDLFDDFLDDYSPDDR